MNRREAIRTALAAGAVAVSTAARAQGTLASEIHVNPAAGSDTNAGTKAAPLLTLSEAARRNGMRTLREDGWAKVALGSTSADEVLRVTQEF